MSLDPWRLAFFRPVTLEQFDDERAVFRLDLIGIVYLSSRHPRGANNGSVENTLHRPLNQRISFPGIFENIVGHKTPDGRAISHLPVKTSGPLPLFRRSSVRLEHPKKQVPAETGPKLFQARTRRHNPK